MSAKQIGIILVASIALVALLGCVREQVPAGPECVAEGETIPVIANPPSCCPGLELIPPKEENWLGISGYCTAKCGNGTCDEETESNYNCPADCTTQAEGEQVVGPEYYSSEQEAFDALGEEIDGLEEPSTDELEQMLGQ